LRRQPNRDAVGVVYHATAVAGFYERPRDRRWPKLMLLLHIIIENARTLNFKTAEFEE